MFDNLKDKLGSFRKDAEEAAEENVEEVDEDELEDEEMEAVDPDATPTEATAAEATDTTPETAAAETAASASAAVEPDADREPDAESKQGATTESATADAADAAGQEPATDSDSDDADSVTDEPRSAEEPTETAAGDEESPADEDEGDDADDGGRTGFGAKARSLFTGSSDDPESDSDETTPEEAQAPEATPGEEPVDVAAGTEESPVDEDEGDDADDGNSTGFGTKAKSLVKGKFVIEEEDLEGPLHELEMALLSSDVEMGVAEEILDNIRDELVGETRTFTTSTGEVVEEALHNAIYDVISVGQFDFDERIAVEDRPVTIIFTGVNGVGKTTSIAKMSRYFEERGYSTVMANGDTYRAGANEQIQEHADALGTKCISHEQGGDPAAVLYDAVEYAEANDVDIVLGDTAGRLHTNEGLMDQLEKIGRVVDPDMTLFVDEAVAGQDAVNRAREFDEAAEIDGAILTKADADSNGGAAISVAHVTGKPILFLGVGQGYDDLERFDPDEMVERLLADE
ncbi:signal recognition particle-docking protein FtsY [Natrinema longum]|uniref:Signal recognition particle receptor FtsY n=1 Tax=Natrinema longum TaxID=370324 RepID=A0A8A2U586_9EURY|nr:signal recognition particle-docking protein FtsY [Natrinema longum]MBZ6494823.1 signal recognition particle-docking protein FtsY [Natrinema longum]QSW83873.1 signal recognition particle-docking protein FtsY [Natrinema longum]